MDPDTALLEHDWLGACRRSAEGLQRILADNPSRAARVAETGTLGAGGDRTLTIDALAEAVVLAELQLLHDAGARFTVVTEERGHVDFGDPGVVVVIDPIDGSLNAKRGLLHFALSVAVANGPRMEDVVFAYVFDAGAREEWRAVRGAGAWLGDERLTDSGPERLTRAGLLEIVAIESASPVRLAASSVALQATAHRVRALGTIAVALCQVAAGRADAMVSLGPCRSFDAAAAQLIVHEAGGLVTFAGLDDPAGPALADLAGSWPVVAARTRVGLERAAMIPAGR